MKIKIKVQRREVNREYMKTWILKNTYFNVTGINWIFEEIPETMDKFQFIQFMYALCEYTDYTVDDVLQFGFPSWDYDPVCDYIEKLMIVRYIRNYFNGY